MSGKNCIRQVVEFSLTTLAAITLAFRLGVILALLANLF